jgi:hypothetical protein
VDYKKLNKDLKAAYRTAAKNAAKRGIPFDLSQESFAEIAARAGDKCELTGIPFDYTKGGKKWHRRPWAASLDRIDSGKGYSADNCRLLCVAVNLALNAWGADVLYAVARGLLGFGDAESYIGAMKKHTGVSPWRGKRGIRFRARIRVDGKLKHLGTFQTAEAAYRAFNYARQQRDSALEQHQKNGEPDKLLTRLSIVGGERGIRTP